MNLVQLEDRGMAVPAGVIVRTAYVPVGDVVLACRERMAVGDVAEAYQRRLNCQPGQPWPCPVGEWQGSRFAIRDGRHEFIAALMLGCQYVLVAWLEARKATPAAPASELAES